MPTPTPPAYTPVRHTGVARSPLPPLFLLAAAVFLITGGVFGLAPVHAAGVTCGTAFTQSPTPTATDSVEAGVLQRSCDDARAVILLPAGALLALGGVSLMAAGAAAKLKRN